MGARNLKKCTEEGCDKVAVFGKAGTSGVENKSHCAGHGRALGLVDIVTKKCLVDGCEIRPCFGEKGTNKATHCLAHGIDLGLVNVKVTCVCRFPGCEERADYGKAGSKGTVENRTHCRLHGLEIGLVNITIKRCEEEGCSVLPSLGEKGTKRSTHCKAHGEPLGLVSVSKPFCTFPGCETIASFIPEGGTTAQFCKSHTPDGSFTKDLRQCALIGCLIRPSYGDLSNDRPTHCSTHGRALGLQRVRSSKCCVEDCDVMPSYGIEGTRISSHCASHGKPLGYVNVTSKQCCAEGCRTVPIFGPEDSTIGIMCKQHGEERDYVDIRNRKCAFVQEGVRCRTQVHGDNLYCASHDLEKKRSYRVSEAKLRHWLKTNINIPWTATDTCIMQQACGPRYRPDFLWELNDKVIVIENDEDQHRGTAYSCEARRMVDIVNSYGGLPVIFIRFNPDKLRYINEHKQSNPDFRRRVKILGLLFQQALESPSSELLTIHKIAFDGCSNSLLKSSTGSWSNGQFHEIPFVNPLTL